MAKAAASTTTTAPPTPDQLAAANVAAQLAALHGPVVLVPQPGDTIVVMVGSEMEPAAFEQLGALMRAAFPHQYLSLVTNVTAVGLIPAAPEHGQETKDACDA